MLKSAAHFKCSFKRSVEKFEICHHKFMFHVCPQTSYFENTFLNRETTYFLVDWSTMPPFLVVWPTGPTFSLKKSWNKSSILDSKLSWNCRSSFFLTFCSITASCYYKDISNMVIVLLSRNFVVLSHVKKLL